MYQERRIGAPISVGSPAAGWLLDYGRRGRAGVALSEPPGRLAC